VPPVNVLPSANMSLALQHPPSVKLNHANREKHLPYSFDENMQSIKYFAADSLIDYHRQRSIRERSWLRSPIKLQLSLQIRWQTTSPEKRSRNKLVAIADYSSTHAHGLYTHAVRHCQSVLWKVAILAEGWEDNWVLALQTCRSEMPCLIHT